ncbi:uncharacterized protein LOC136027406 [Artemia franciscana]|uniref:uncharacterized protein LOC136027406 n=1 Tax=Artemia franciscana TaxID=6661 RepID=UPI0032DB7958
MSWNIYRENIVKSFFVLMGDFNAYTSEEPEIPLVSLSGKDLTSLRIPESYKIPRRSQDVKRKVNQWRRRLLGICREFGLVIGNGRFGNDAGRALNVVKLEEEVEPEAPESFECKED